MKIYESVIDIVQGEAHMLFVNLPYTLATEEAERIGVDHVVRMSTHENGGKSAGKYVTIHNIVKSLTHIFLCPFFSGRTFECTTQCHQNVTFARQIDSVIH